MNAAIALAALLSLLPDTARTRCVRARAATIIHDASAASAATGVPVEVLLVVGYLESALGCDPRSGGCWGAPISPRRRDVAGRASHAAAALAAGYRVCTTDLGAVSRFRYGLCRTPRRHNRGYTPEDAMRWVSRTREAHRRRLAMSEHGGAQ